MSRRYWQLDVFAERPLTGNGLAVFDDASTLDDAAMQAWTRELRQFESIFLLPGDDPRAFGARIFTLEEELPFAGHPLLGAAALAELDSQRCNGCGACLAPCPSQAIQLRALSNEESPRHA